MGYASQIVSIASYLPNEFYKLRRGTFDLHDISVHRFCLPTVTLVLCKLYPT